MDAIIATNSDLVKELLELSQQLVLKTNKIDELNSAYRTDCLYHLKLENDIQLATKIFNQFKEQAHAKKDLIDFTGEYCYYYTFNLDTKF